MTFWRRIKQSHKLWNQFSRSYLQIHSPISANRTRTSVINQPILPGYAPANIRSFAAPVQFTQNKKEDKDTTGPRLNEQITADIVRLVTDQGHSVLSRHEALKRAKSLKLDLVEVQRNAQPPVCKLMEYHKERYKQELKEKDRSKKKSEVALRKGACKEVRFAAKISPNDLQIKADMVKRLMENGYRVKCVAIGKVDKGEDSATLLSRFSDLVQDVSVVESDNRVEEKDQAHVILRHIKYGPLKKGSVKKVSMDKKAAGASVQEVDSDGDVEHKEISGWTISNANDDKVTVFDLLDQVDGVSKSSRSERFSIGHDHEPLRSCSSELGRRDTLPRRRGTEGVNSECHASINYRHPGQHFAPNFPDTRIPRYGIFNGRQSNDADVKESIPAEVNRYKERNALDSRRNSSPEMPATGHQSGPLFNSKVGGERGVN